jgi:hypothetical protein
MTIFRKGEFAVDLVLLKIGTNSVEAARERLPLVLRRKRSTIAAMGPSFGSRMLLPFKLIP